MDICVISFCTSKKRGSAMSCLYCSRSISTDVLTHFLKLASPFFSSHHSLAFLGPRATILNKYSASPQFLYLLLLDPCADRSCIPVFSQHELWEFLPCFIHPVYLLSTHFWISKLAIILILIVYLILSNILSKFDSKFDSKLLFDY